jgi:streptogramin lyase
MTDMGGGGWTTLSTKSGGGDHFSSPRGIAVDASGVIWVGDELGARLVQTAIDGTNWAVTPLPNSSTGSPANPTTLAFAPSGALYVSAFHFNYVAELNGGTTTLFTTEPHGDTFSHSFGVAVGP